MPSAEGVIRNHTVSLSPFWLTVDILGLLKPEFVSTNGSFIGLGPKSYFLTQNDNGEVKVKKGAKGKKIQFSNLSYVKSRSSTGSKVNFGSFQICTFSQHHS